jgi:O-methyltransferase
VATPEELYLDLLKRMLTREGFGDTHGALAPRGTVKRLAVSKVRRVLRSRGLDLVRRLPSDDEARREGRELPTGAETMIGLRRLDNIQACVTDVLRRGVPGDLIETGVWRGGATIFMRAVLKAYGDTERVVWAADSFEGLPKPNAGEYPLDANDPHWAIDELKIPLENVRANFARYGLLDSQVRFLAGWFHETLPDAPIEQLSILRLDGDMYESTIVALQALYPRLSPGGYVIVDDYGAVARCRAATDDFRREHGIDDPIAWIDHTGVFWQRG